MARSAVLAGRTAADTVSVTVQTVLMLIVAYLIGYRIHEGGSRRSSRSSGSSRWGTRSRGSPRSPGLSLKTIEAVQAALFTIVFPFVFVSTAFVPLATFPSWLQPIVEHNPVTIWVDTVRVLTLGDLYTPQTERPVRATSSRSAPCLWLSIVWFAGFLVVLLLPRRPRVPPDLDRPGPTGAEASGTIRPHP